MQLIHLIDTGTSRNKYANKNPIQIKKNLLLIGHTMGQTGSDSKELSGSKVAVQLPTHSRCNPDTMFHVPTPKRQPALCITRFSGLQVPWATEQLTTPRGGHARTSQREDEVNVAVSGSQRERGEKRVKGEKKRGRTNETRELKTFHLD